MRSDGLRARGGGDGVEQLAERHGGRAPGAGPRVGARVEDDQVLGRGTHRVEQQLAVFAARVALADAGISGEHVVAVVHACSRERAVVEPEQADHPMRDRAHRHHRRDGETAGAEVGPPRSPAQPLGQQPAHVREAQRRGAHGRVRDVGELGPGLARLPGVGGGGGRQRVERADEAGDPGGQRTFAGQVVQRRAEPVDELGEPAEPVDVAGLDVVERQRRAQPALALHRDPEQQPVEARRPRCSAGSRRAGTGGGAARTAPTAPRRGWRGRATGRGRRRRGRSGAGRGRPRAGRAPRTP